MKLLINIGALVGARAEAPARLAGAEMNDIPVLENAWLKIDGERIAGFGSMCGLDIVAEAAQGVEVTDIKGEWVFPAFCDSHTHIVYAGERSGEFP